MKKVLMVVLCAAVLSTTVLAFAEDVYSTKNGKKYHKEDCRLIKNKGAEKITPSEASAKGLEPCAKCFKDEVSSASGDQQKQQSLVKKSKKSK